ncbi:MAG: GH3 auxin-responsive promoter family protein [Saprospiraceae bacterium]|nr:MAG: GH3 auxin-responsive promoter [Candidatus Parvibacillus calidus]MBX2937472.1 GH3 auxin-responsive promoter family protein [Saprospiraceae bacterium]MBK7741987.1 GH3 auxin-responsive promoter family protein [Candidatus Parvibacillus calidus]MBX7178037.1 GH3 auxin-responsive promoter family protein [Saprospiraceae bacterium]MCB0590894.1 GH3 auxin-responsive promoter family protein [Saprospiraceae bacterium]
MVGQIVEKAFRVANLLKRPLIDPSSSQKEVLTQLMIKAQNTSFGLHYKFSSLLYESDIVEKFRSTVPIFDYDKIHNEWWHRLLECEPDVCWPGRVRNFALSSGTSGSASKFIPVSRDMQRSMRKAGLRLFMNMANVGIPAHMFNKAMLMIGGSASLTEKYDYRYGDLSGINGASPPFWIKGYYKPGTEIAKIKDWNERTRIIVENAHKWDIGYLTGIPSWVQMTLAAIIEHYKLKTIHDLWPNLSVFVTGGVNYQPYEASFNEMFAKEVIIIDSYLASEGFIAFQSRTETNAMRLLLDNGIFMEFVPFNEENFDEDGNIYPHAKTKLISEVDTETDYALLLTTNSGAWRYLLGDLIRFSNLQHQEIHIVGRTKHFLSVCGEHLSVDNMTSAVLQVQKELGLHISEFTASYVEHEDFFRHKWYLACDSQASINDIKKVLDSKLCEINDDYDTERRAGVLKEPAVEIIPTQWFYDYMERQGKLTGQTKFPRVIKHQAWEQWERYVLEKQGILSPR